MNRILTIREAVILTIIQKDSRYGTQILQEYEDQTGNTMPIGSLYTTLKRMSDKNLIKSKGQTGRFKYYDVTPYGKRRLHSFLSSCGLQPKAV